MNVKETADQTLDLAQRQAEQAIEQTKQAPEDARAAARKLEGTLKEAGYMTLGAGDVAVHAARQLPAFLRHAPENLADLAEQVAEGVRDGASDLADRGRRLTGQVKRSPKVTEARAQTRAASAQVKGARTSVSKAAQAQADAAATAAAKAGQPPRPSTPSATREPDAGSGPLEDRTVDELRTRAAELDIHGRSQMTKQELIAAIRARQ